MKATVVWSVTIYISETKPDGTYKTHLELKEEIYRLADEGFSIAEPVIHECDRKDLID